MGALGGREHGKAGAPLLQVAGALAARDPSSAGSWIAGARGEGLTALVLRPFTYAGAVVLHNRRRPGLRSDLDHTMFSRWGNFYFNSKMMSRCVLTMKHGILYREERPVDFSGVQIETDIIRGYISAPVTGAVVVHGALGIPLNGLWARTTFGPRILVVNWRGLIKLILTSPYEQDRERVARLSKRFMEHFEGYNAVEVPWWQR